MPILLLIFAGAADLGRAFYAYVAIENAAKEGALFGSRVPLCDEPGGPGCSNPNNVVWHVQNELVDQGVRAPNGAELTPTIQCTTTGGAAKALTACAEGDVYVVGLTYPFELLTPILGSVVGDLELRSVSRAGVLNSGSDRPPGASVQKFVAARDAINESEIVAKCLEPDESDADGYYRSPCQDSTTADPSDRLTLRFEEGTTIRYKITIANTGTVNLTGIDVDDSRSSTGPWPSSLAVGSSRSDEYTRRAPDVSGSSNDMDYVNTVTFDTAQTLETQDAVSVIVERPPARLRILKWVSSFRQGDDGDGEPSFGTDPDITVSTNAFIDEAEVWYKVILRNTGGRTATDIDIDDTNGTLPYGRDNATADCSSRPRDLDAGDTWECRYREDFDSPGTTVNTVTVTADNVIPDNDDDASATVRVTSCTGTNRVVPDLIGLEKDDAVDEWEDAGFDPDNLDMWSGNNRSDVETQSRQAYSCVSENASMDVTRTETD
jgi:uncharacterized repeat protein (TIGR01451 family)